MAKLFIIFRLLMAILIAPMRITATGMKLVMRPIQLKRSFSTGECKKLPIPWKLPFTAIGIGSCICYLHYERIRDQYLAQFGVFRGWPVWKVCLYRSLPLRVTSRVWGWITSVELPMGLRTSILGLYVSTFNCDLEEAEHSELSEYPSLKALFCRKLKSGVRAIANQPLVCPADGTFLKCGEVKNGQIEQVKGLTFDVKEFLGPQLSEKLDKTRKLFYCVVYLAPGDYHGFHSPTEWEVSTRRHFSGKLLSVNSYILERVERLFALNERILLWGKWRHGLFTMTAVGATNVGNIHLDKETELVTNKIALGWKHEDKTVNWRETKGERIGGFRLGSSIVLLFQAPDNFKFLAKEGSTVKVGQALGEI